MGTPLQIVFDCANPDQLARFWAGALHSQVQPPPEGYATWEDLLREMNVPEDQWDSASAIVDTDGNGPRVFFQKVPEGKANKNRLHLDLNVSRRREVGDEKGKQRVDEEVQRLVALGANQVRAVEQHGEYWVVMQDPEGNEFCVQ